MQECNLYNDLAPARGVLNGLIVSALFWAFIVCAFWWA